MMQMLRCSVVFCVLLLGANAAKIGEAFNETEKRSYGGGCALSPLVKWKRFLGLHNIARAQSGAQPLTWDNDLASFAQCWANRCQFQHSQTRGLGENIACGSGPYTLSESMDDWWQEYKLWRPGMGFGEATGHFTQMAWKDTRRVGCGVAKCPAYQLGLGGTYRSGMFVVCEYYPAGNVIGRFRGEVQVPSRAVDLTRMSVNSIIAYANWGYGNASHTLSNYSHTANDVGHTISNNVGHTVGDGTRTVSNTYKQYKNKLGGNNGTSTTPATTGNGQGTRPKQYDNTVTTTGSTGGNNGNNFNNIDNTNGGGNSNDDTTQQFQQTGNMPDNSTNSKSRHGSPQGLGTKSQSSNGDYYGTSPSSHAKTKVEGEDCAEEHESSPPLHIVYEQSTSSSQDEQSGDEKQMQRLENRVLKYFNSVVESLGIGKRRVKDPASAEKHATAIRRSAMQKKATSAQKRDADEDMLEEREDDDEDEKFGKREDDDQELRTRDETDEAKLEDRDAQDVVALEERSTLSEKNLPGAKSKVERGLDKVKDKRDVTDEHTRARRWATFAMHGNHKRRLQH